MHDMNIEGVRIVFIVESLSTIVLLLVMMTCSMIVRLGPRWNWNWLNFTINVFRILSLLLAESIMNPHYPLFSYKVRLIIRIMCWECIIFIKIIFDVILALGLEWESLLFRGKIIWCNLSLSYSLIRYFFENRFRMRFVQKSIIRSIWIVTMPSVLIIKGLG